ncbi:hypothetical protein [Nocardioides sp.]|uniref:MmyB family transcriptional regulator n=1 Tax=Nocardioides sp. TaxID=35761 RepID=UPI0039C926F4
MAAGEPGSQPVHVTRRQTAARGAWPSRRSGPTRLDLHLSELAVEGTDGQTLVVYHAEPGTDTAERLALLASPTAGQAGDVVSAASP